MSIERSRLARVTRHALLVIIPAFVILSGVYSVVTPLFEGPDEIWHFAYADHLADGGGLPVFDADEPATVLRNGAHPPLYYALIAAVIAPIDRSDFPAEFQFNLANPLITRGAAGTAPNLLIHTAREDWPWRSTTLAAHLARGVSIALNALALGGVWLVARRVLHDDRLALLALTVAAFVPQFVYGAAMINNDALAAASVTWLLVALLRWFDAPALKWAAIGGGLLGLTLLSKIGLIALLPVPALTICLYAIRHMHDARLSGRRLLAQAAVMYGAAFLIAGWFYLRNWSLYGDPLAWREWQALTGAGRVPPTVGDFIGDMIGLFGTFWIDFSLRVDRVWWPVFGGLVLAALLGLGRRAIRREWPLDGAPLLIALSVFALLLASAVRYAFNIYDIHGRLLYPALAAIGMTLALGLSAWKRRALTMGLSAIPLVFTIVSPSAIIQPAYARPIVSALPDDAAPTSVQFGDVALIGYAVKPDQVRAGESINVVTYWRRMQPATDRAGLYVEVALLALNSGELLGRGEALLGSGAYPSWAWQSTDLVATETRFPTEASASAVGDLWLSVRDEAALIPSEQGETIGLGRVIVRGALACQPPLTVGHVTFGGSIKLIGYRATDTAVVLCWEALKPVDIDYTVFVHGLDDAGATLSADGQPRNGAYPTSVWLAGEQIMDTHVLTAPARQLSIGLYRLETGERLMIDGTQETELELIK